MNKRKQFIGNPTFMIDTGDTQIMHAVKNCIVATVLDVPLTRPETGGSSAYNLLGNQLFLVVDQKEASCSLTRTARRASHQITAKLHC